MDRNRTLLEQSRREQQALANELNERDDMIRASQRSYWDHFNPWSPFPNGDYGNVSERRALGGSSAPQPTAAAAAAKQAETSVAQMEAKR